MLPRSLAPALRVQMLAASAWWESNRQLQLAGTQVPDALAVKYPQLERTWGWYWIFPSPTLSVDPRSDVEWQHHLIDEFAAQPQKNRGACWHCQACLSAHLALQFCHPFIAIGHRHSHGAGVAGRQRREYDHDLHPCPQGSGGWNNLATGFVVANLTVGRLLHADDCFLPAGRQIPNSALRSQAADSSKSVEWPVWARCGPLLMIA